MDHIRCVVERITYHHAVHDDALQYAAEESAIYGGYQGEEDPGACRREESCELCDTE